MIVDLAPFASTGMRRASLLKERIRPHMRTLCRYLLPHGAFDGTNWRVGSTDGEPGRSLSVCLEGRSAGCWNDFAGHNDHGDIIDLWKQVRKTDFPSTLEEMETWLASLPSPAAGGSERLYTAQSTQRYVPWQMPMEVAHLWQSGLCWLSSRTWMQFAIDGWRGWPRGTTARLCERQLMGLIKEPGNQAWLYAFIIEHPTSTGLVQIGFHSRGIAPLPGQKPHWNYRPNSWRDGCRVASVPFVLGAEECSRAKRIIVLEGQWDAIAWAAAAGWLDGWPRDTMVFGLRGASTWKAFLDAWQPFWPSQVSFLLVPDGDEAGQQWRSGFAARLRASGHRVEIFSPPAGMDFSDLQRQHPFTPEQIGQLIDASFHG